MPTVQKCGKRVNWQVGYTVSNWARFFFGESMFSKETNASRFAFIRNSTSQDTPIITCGASFGALHRMNLFLKRPHIINGVIAMSGVYDLTEYTKGHYDDDVYFNSPLHFMSNLDDHNVLEQIRQSKNIHILTGSGSYEDPGASGKFAKILYDKGIWYELDVWGEEWPHDWNTWRAMLPHYLGSRF